MSTDVALTPTYVLVDGENIDATLGNVLGRRPNPDERPRWERLLEFTATRWDRPTRGLFFLNASHGLPMTFVQALMALGYRPIPLSGQPGDKVVDIGILRTLAALEGRPGDVLLVSHDGDFLAAMSKLLMDGGRRVGVVAFREFLNGGFGELVAEGLEVFDLEEDVRAFVRPLNRVRVIPLDEFDPLLFL